MLKPVNCSLLLLIFLAITSCKNSFTEKQETTSWHRQVVDSALNLLYSDEDTARALRYFDSVIQQSSAVTEYPRSARFNLIANYHYFFTSDNKATAAMIDSALAYYPTAELQDQYPRTYVGLLLFGGNIAYRLNQYSKANEYYFRAKTLADAHLDPCERTSFNYSIAMVSFRQQNFAASLNYFKEAYQLQQTCKPQTAAVVLQQQEIQSNIGLCFVELKQYDSAMKHFDNALAIAEANKDSLGAVFMDKIHGVIHGNKAKVFMATNQLKTAERLFLQSIALNDREGYEQEFALGTKLQLASLYGRQKRFDNMYRILKQAAPSIVRTNAQSQLEWNKLMASYYEETQRSDSAISYLKNHLTLGNLIHAEQKELTEADVARQLNDKEQQLQISILTKEKEMAVVSLWATIVFFLMAVVIIALVYQHYQRSKKSLAIHLR